MVYTAALPFGHGLRVRPEEEEGVVDMIGKYFCQLASPDQAAASARRGSVDSCDERENAAACWSQDPGPEEQQRLLHQEVTRQLERCLTAAKATVLRCQLLLLPRHMTARVGRHILRASAGEPCGLRGASIQLFVEGKDGVEPVGSIVAEPFVTPTFELSVVLRADTGGRWTPLRHIFEPGKVLKLRPEYRLVKRKLYSSASPVVRDFSLPR